jgi:hypothetical protein
MSEGDKEVMRKFNSTRRIRRCRNVGDISCGEYAEHIGGKHASGKFEVTFERAISAKLGVALDSDDLFCRMCGAVPGDIDDLTRQEVRFHIEHLEDKKVGEIDELPNFRALCLTCYSGARDIQTEKPSSIWLLSQVRRAGHDEQRTVLAALLKKFGEGQ